MSSPVDFCLLGTRHHLSMDHLNLEKCLLHLVKLILLVVAFLAPIGSQRSL